MSAHGIYARWSNSHLIAVHYLHNPFKSADDLINFRDDKTLTVQRWPLCFILGLFFQT